MSNEYVALEDAEKIATHEPAIRNGVHGNDNYVVDCSCGWVDPSFYGALEGARIAWLGHVLGVFVPDDWKPGIESSLLPYVEVR
jgi:hypothetical protein